MSDSSPVGRLNVLEGKMRGSLELPSGLCEGLEEAGGALEDLLPAEVPQFALLEARRWSSTRPWWSGGSAAQSLPQPGMVK